MWLAVTALESANREHFHHCRMSCWTVAARSRILHHQTLEITLWQPMFFSGFPWRPWIVASALQPWQDYCVVFLRQAGASMVAQWCSLLVNAGDTVRSLILEDPVGHRSTEAVHHNCWACAPEPGRGSYWAHVLQRLKPSYGRAHALQQERPLQWEPCTPQLESSPTTGEGARAATKTRPSQKYIN